MSFAQWLRSNSEYYLLWAAQDRIAEQKGIKSTSKSRGLKDRFWRYIFAPTYFALPQGLRQFAMYSLPGSHRRSWPSPTRRPRIKNNDAFHTHLLP